MDSANAMPAGVQATPQPPKEDKKWGKWVVIILVILAILLISGIVIVTLTGMGVISFGADDKKNTEASQTEDTGEENKQDNLQKKIDSASGKDASLENEINQYIKEATAEHGDDAYETAQAKSLLAAYYFKTGNQKTGERYLKSEMTRLTGSDDEDGEGGTQMTDEQMDAYITYGKQLFDYYYSIEEVENTYELAVKMFHVVPDDVALPYDNWLTIKADMIRLNDALAASLEEE